MSSIKVAKQAWKPVARFFIVLLATGVTSIHAATISIIIDDLGHRLVQGKRAVSLPGPVACAILPHSQHSLGLARLAHEHNKEVLLHQPMESLLGDKDPGPGKILASMPDLEIATTVAYNLQSLPHVVGMNNHMGSKLTADARAMAAVMETMRGHQNLFFLDSVTSPVSIAADTARQFNITTLTRDIFLDNDPNPAAIHKQLDKLIRLAKQRGHAIGIGHPYPETMDVLEQRLVQLRSEGVSLISLGQHIVASNTAQHRKKTTWQPSSFHSQKVSKSLKPSPSPTYSRGPALK